MTDAKKRQKKEEEKITVWEGEGVDESTVFATITQARPDFRPETITVDFEAAVWAALREDFPDAELHGCTFHWCQAVFRKIQAMGLQPAFMEHGHVHQVLKKKLLALPLLPRMEIRRKFDELRETASTNDKITELLAYVKETWFGEQFPIRLVVRTNNDVEGWHNRLLSRGGANKMNMYALIDVLESEAKVVALHCQLVASRALCVRERTNSRRQEISSLWHDYDSQELPIDKLWQELTRYLPY